MVVGGVEGVQVKFGSIWIGRLKKLQHDEQKTAAAAAEEKQWLRRKKHQKFMLKNYRNLWTNSRELSKGSQG